MKRSIRPARAYRIDGKEMFVFDGLFPRRVIRQVHEDLDRLDFQRNRNVDLNHGYPEWSVSLDLAASRRHPVVLTTAALLRDLFPAYRMVLRQSYCKQLAYGDCPYPHTDTTTDFGGIVISAAYCANPTWDPTWGGETVFFNDHKEAVVCVAPRPGRVIIFRGLLWHRAGVPMRNCTQSRYSLISKFFGEKKATAGRPASIDAGFVVL